MISNGSGFIYQLSYQDDNNWIVIASVILTAFILIGIVVYKYPIFFAGKLLPKTDDINANIKYSLKDIQVVAFSIIGLYILVTGVPRLLYWLYIFQQVKYGPVEIELAPENIANFISTILEIIIGFWLLLGAKGLQGLLYKIRNVGMNN